MPADLTVVYVDCLQCHTRNPLAPELIQSRQQQYDLLAMSAERARQFHEQQKIRERMLSHRRASSRRSIIVLLTVLGLLFLLPVAVVAGVFFLGISFAKKAIHTLEQVQDPSKNGSPSILSELRVKQTEGCGPILFGPETRLGGAGMLRMTLDGEGSCAHLLGATGVASTRLTLDPLVPRPLARSLPDAGNTFDYRFCPNTAGTYDFRVTSDHNVPFTIAAIACPRTTAEGLVRSKATDPATSGSSELRAWMEEFENRGCKRMGGEPTVYQGPQVIEVDSVEGGSCFRLLALSHFGDVVMTVSLVAPDGGTIAKPVAASRVNLEYCPTTTGRHRLEVAPSTRDHYALATLDCRRAK